MSLTGGQKAGICCVVSIILFIITIVILTISLSIPEFIATPGIVLLSIAAFVLLLFSVCCYIRFKKLAQSNELRIRSDSEENLTSGYNEESRIKRERISNLCKILPAIFEQEIRKLPFLQENQKSELRNGLINEINNDIDTFLSNYLNGEYKVEINQNNYVGMVMIKFRKDQNDHEYIYIGCLVTFKKYKINDNVNKIKENIQDSINKKLTIQLDKKAA
eukprot:8292_1